MDHVLQFFQQLDNLVWGAPLLVLLVGTGIYLTLRLGSLQIRYLPKAFRLIFTEDEGHGDISSFIRSYVIFSILIDFQKIVNHF